MARDDDKIIDLRPLFPGPQQRVNGKFAEPHAYIAEPTLLQSFWERLNRKGMRGRFAIVLGLWAMQLVYFPINKRSKGNRNLAIKQIDGRIPRRSEFVVAYFLGLIYLSLMHQIAALFLSKRHFRGHYISSITATLTGFLIWIFYPARVTKKPFQPRPGNLFDRALHSLHYHDKDYGQYNSFPSSHVYYVAIGLSYLAKEYPHYYWFFYGSSVANALSTLFTHQHYVADVLSGFALTYTAIEFSEHVTIPLLMGHDDGDSEADD